MSNENETVQISLGTVSIPAVMLSHYRSSITEAEKNAVFNQIMPRFLERLRVTLEGTKKEANG
jgi:hypothetical protein